MKLLNAPAANPATVAGANLIEKPVKAYVSGRVMSGAGVWVTAVDITNGSGIVELLKSTTTSSQVLTFRVTVDGVEVFNGEVGGYDSGKTPWLGYGADAGFAPFGFSQSCKIEIRYGAAGYSGDYGVRVFA